MKHRLLAPALALFLLLAITTGTVWSMSSTSFNVPFDSAMGGGSGGGSGVGVSTSTNFRMEGTFEGAVHMFDTSSSFKLCSGFACFVVNYKEGLPSIMKSP